MFGFGKRTYTKAEMASLLSSVSPGHCAKIVAFSAEDRDGRIGPRSHLRIYLVNDGTMSLGDVGEFMLDAGKVLRRKAEYYPMPSSTTREEMREMGCTIVYTA